MEIIQVAEWTVDFGGEEPSGFLLTGVAKPPATPVVRVELALAILSEGPTAGYILEWRRPTPETSGNSRYASVETAVVEAERQFGVPPDAWAKVGA